MPALGDDGSVYALKKVDGEKVNVCILKSTPAKGGKGGQNRMVLTDEGVDWIVDEISGGATIEECIAMLGVSSKTLYSQSNKFKVKDAIEKGNELCNRKLRRAQVNAALNGNTTMLVWLGKNRLGQTDSPGSMGNEILSEFANAIIKASKPSKSDAEGWEE